MLNNNDRATARAQRRWRRPLIQSASAMPWQTAPSISSLRHLPRHSKLQLSSSVWIEDLLTWVVNADDSHVFRSEIIIFSLSTDVLQLQVYYPRLINKGLCVGLRQLSLVNDKTNSVR